MLKLVVLINMSLDFWT